MITNPKRIPRRRKPGHLNLVRLWILGGLILGIAIHMLTWYKLGWNQLGKFSFSGWTSLLVGHINMAAVFCMILTLGLLFTGRLFCGYACKMSAFQEATEWIYSRIGFQPQMLHTRARVVRLFIYVPYLLPVLYTWKDVGLTTHYYDLGAVEPWTGDLPSGDTWMNVFALINSDAATWFSPFVTTVLLSIFYFAIITFGMTALFGRRAFCRLVCPFALFFQLFEHIPTVARIRQVGRCINCKVCEQTCPMGIDVPNDVLRVAEIQNPECIRCMICVDVCPVKALKYKVRPGRFPPQQPELPPSFRESAFPVWADVLMATGAVICGVWAATRITGFHVFLGASVGLMGGGLLWMILQKLSKSPQRVAVNPSKYIPSQKESKSHD
jgi:polyferredoxin